MFLGGDKGISLVESLVSVMLTFIIAVFIAGMITNFALFTRTDKTLLCLIQAASSGIDAKKANPNINSLVVNCSGLAINVTVTGSLPAYRPPGTGESVCSTIRSSASYGGKSIELADMLCNFGS